MSSYWSGKGRGEKIAIKFDKPLLGDVTGNEGAFTVTGMVRNPLRHGVLEPRQFEVESVERYPVATLFEDDFEGGDADGVELGPNGLRLEQGGQQAEDFEEGNIFILGDMPVARQSGSAKNGSYGLRGTPVTATSQKVADDVVGRGEGFLFSGWVRTDADHTTTGLTGLCFGVPAGIGISGYQVVVDVRSGEAGTIPAFQIRKDYAASGLLASSQTPTISTNAWYFIEIEWTAAGLITARLYDASLNLLDVLFVTDATYTSGRYGVCCYSNSSFDDISIGVAEYAESGTYAPPPIDTSTLPPDPRIRFEADAPEGTSVIVEYATSDSDTTPPGTWTEVGDGDLLTIDGDYLWLRYTLETEDTAVTPTLLGLWIEEAEAPPDTILLTFDTYNRFNDVEGDITVAYTQALGTLAGVRPVEDFSESFEPEDLEPSPVDEHIITVRGEPVVDFINVTYEPGYEAHTVTVTGTGVLVDFIHVDDIPP